MNTFKVVGNGNIKVLLLPGLLGTQDAFDAMLAYADFERFQYAVMDYRGYGQSRRRPGLYTLGEIVTDATRMIDYLGWDSFTVAGHSLGALAAQMLALAMPARVSGLVSLAGMSAAGGARDPQRRQMLREAAQDPARRQAIVEAGTSGQYTPGFAAAVVRAGWDAIAPEAFAGYAHSAAETDISAQVKDSALRTLVLVGERDPANSASVARDGTMQWYRQATLEVLAGAGHYPMLEVPARTISAIERFAGD